MATWNEYLEFVPTTSRLSHLTEFDRKVYLLCGLMSEVGECWGVYKRVLRDNIVIGRDANADMLAELGDVLWYTAMLFNCLPPIQKQDKPSMAGVGDLLYLLMELQTASVNVYENLFVMMTSGMSQRMSQQFNEAIASNLWEIVEIIRQMSTFWDSNLLKVMDGNMEKLRDRAARNVIQGKGDNR